MKIRKILIGAIIFLTLGVLPALAGTSQNVWGMLSNADSSVPGDTDITFFAYITARPGEVLTESTDGNAYQSGAWKVNVGGFSSAWAAGEKLVVEFTNLKNKERGKIEYILKNGPEQTSDKTLAADATVPIVPDLAATSGTTSINLSWGSITGATYNIYRSTISGGDYKAVATNLTTNSYNDTGLTTGTNYYYILIATAGGKNTAHSSEISIVASATGGGTVTSPIGSTPSTGTTTTSATTPSATTNVGPAISASVSGMDLKTGSTIGAQQTINISLTDSDGIKSFAVYMDGAKVSASALQASATTTGQSIKFTPTSALKEGDHTLKIEAEDNAGAKSTLTISGLKVFAELRLTGLVMNYPNPFNPSTQSTTINYKLTQNANVKLYIYDIGGRVVYSSAYDSGTNGGTFENDVVWDGKDFSGQLVANGIYVSIITSGGKVLGKGEIAVIK